MAELSREAPASVLEQQLSVEDYVQTVLLYENTLFPFHRYWARAGICICATVLVMSAIPWYLLQFVMAVVPICAIVFFLVLMLYFQREQPRRRLHGSVLQLCSSRLLRLPGKTSAYQNGIVLENDVGTLSKSWIDFSGRVEGYAYYVLWDGILCPLLVLEKSVLFPEQAERLSAHLRSMFAGRCHLENDGGFR